jgi:SAM-dependent methyltransferase
MKNSSPPAAARGSTQIKQALQRYWDAHPIATDSVPHPPGSRESFEAIYTRWYAGIRHAEPYYRTRFAGRRALEIGCGLANYARFLSALGVHYIGLDYSFRTTQLARAHCGMFGAPARIVQADAAALPFPDAHFDLVLSIGVLHHIPETAAACREGVRVLRPGGTLRAMFYHRRSYHYALVNFVVRPLLWLMLRVPLFRLLLPLAPRKFRLMHEICRQHGFSRERVLAISADTSFPGDGNFIPHSGFYTKEEMREWFACVDLRYFPLPFLRRWIEPRWGFFLHMTARKPAASS